jgi:hypothetical protein
MCGWSWSLEVCPSCVIWRDLSALIAAVFDTSSYFARAAMAGTGYLRVAVAVATILGNWRQMKLSEDAMPELNGHSKNKRRKKP